MCRGIAGEAAGHGAPAGRADSGRNQIEGINALDALVESGAEFTSGHSLSAGGALAGGEVILVSTGCANCCAFTSPAASHGHHARTAGSQIYWVLLHRAVSQTVPPVDVDILILRTHREPLPVVREVHR